MAPASEAAGDDVLTALAGVPADWPSRQPSRSPLAKNGGRGVRRTPRLRPRLALLLIGGLLAIALIQSLSDRAGTSAALVSAGVVAFYWLVSTALASASRSATAPPLLSNAVVMTDASAPPPDSWVHFVPFRPVRWGLIAVFATFGLGLASVAVALFVQPNPPVNDVEPSWLGEVIPVGVAAVLVIGALYFLGGAVLSLATQLAGSGWPKRFGITLGESGIALRLPGESHEIAWAQLSEADASFRNANNPNHPPIPVLRIAWSDGDASSTHAREFACESLAASPHMLLTALQFYRARPDARGELGTTTAQARLERWAVAAA